MINNLHQQRTMKSERNRVHQKYLVNDHFLLRLSITSHPLQRTRNRVKREELDILAVARRPKPVVIQIHHLRANIVEEKEGRVEVLIERDMTEGKVLLLLPVQGRKDMTVEKAHLQLLEEGEDTAAGKVPLHPLQDEDDMTAGIVEGLDLGNEGLPLPTTEKHEGSRGNGLIFMTMYFLFYFSFIIKLCLDCYVFLCICLTNRLEITKTVHEEDHFHTQGV